MYNTSQVKQCHGEFMGQNHKIGEKIYSLMKNNILMEIRSLICAESPQIKHCLSIKNINFSKHLFLYTLHRMSVSLQNFEYKFPQKSIAVALNQIISRREKATVQNKLMTFYHIFWRLNFFLEKYVIFMGITLFPGSQI